MDTLYVSLKRSKNKNQKFLIFKKGQEEGNENGKARQDILFHEMGGKEKGNLGK
jgi:hypothetical protein